MKGNFRRIINDCKFRCFSQGDDIITQNSNIPLNATRNTIGNASSSSLLINSNNSEEKDPQSFLKDIRINNYKPPHNWAA